MVKIKDILLHELDALRQELLHLKNCQIRYFIFSVTVTGAIFGILGKVEEFNGYFFLSPLVIILPCWVIFFDKAQTITRIVGYYRVIEDIILLEASEKTSICKYIGWENSLKKHRKWIENNKEHKFESKIAVSKRWLNILSMTGPHRYWLIIWYTFFTLSILCIYISSNFLTNDESNLLLAPLTVIILSAISTMKSVYRLIYTSNSYEANEKLWYGVLSSDIKK